MSSLLETPVHPERSRGATPCLGPSTSLGTNGVRVFVLDPVARERAFHAQVVELFKEVRS